MLRKVLLHALKAALLVWRRRVELFWPIWITITIVSAICVALVVENAASPAAQDAHKKSPIFGARTQSSNWRSLLTALASVALSLVGYIALMLAWEDFAYYDSSYLTFYPLRGIDYNPPIWTNQGRFFPLGHQEFNLVRHFTGTLIGYHALPIFQLVILSCILLTVGRAGFQKEAWVSSQACFLFRGPARVPSGPPPLLN
jgi:hypothetical protein